MHWSPDTIDPDYEKPIGYIIYKNHETELNPEDFHPIDTVNAAVLSYTDYKHSVNTERLNYQLAALSTLNHTSQKTKTHSNLFITSEYDSCHANINLSWLPYQGWANQTIADSLALYVGTTSSWTVLPLKDSVYKYNTRYTITDVDENEDYYIYLSARRNDAPFTTFSNLHHVYTRMARHPAYMNMDSVIAEDKRVRLYFSIDPGTGLSDFRVMRWEQPDSSRSIFSAKELHKFSEPTTFSFNDTTDSWATRTRPFYYKVDAYNGCKASIPTAKAVKTTTLCKTIIPKVVNRDLTNTIVWFSFFHDPYRRPNSVGNNIYYEVYRYAYTATDDISGLTEPELIATTPDTTFVDDVSGFRRQSESGPIYRITFKYVVKAFEVSMLGQKLVMSQSRPIVTEVIPGVTLPTAIDPSDSRSANGHSRNLFEPVINFLASYTLSVYDRWGGLIFQGENQGWDGRNSKGVMVKEGSYVYRLVVKTSGDRDVVRTGSVVVVYNRK